MALSGTVGKPLHFANPELGAGSSLSKRKIFQAVGQLDAILNECTKSGEHAIVPIFNKLRDYCKNSINGLNGIYTLERNIIGMAAF